MKETITRIRYRWGLSEDPERVDTLPEIDLSGADIPPAVLEVARSARILELSGFRGDPSAGAPTEVDDLLIETQRSEIRIRVYNRGIHLLSSDDDELVRIHRVCSMLQPLLPRPEHVKAQVVRH
jgi:hypothetical protein